MRVDNKLNLSFPLDNAEKSNSPPFLAVNRSSFFKNLAKTDLKLSFFGLLIADTCFDER